MSIDHIHAFNNLTKYTISIALRMFATKIQKSIISNINKKLGCC